MIETYRDVYLIMTELGVSSVWAKDLDAIRIARRHTETYGVYHWVEERPLGEWEYEEEDKEPDGKGSTPAKV